MTDTMIKFFSFSSQLSDLNMPYASAIKVGKVQSVPCPKCTRLMNFVINDLKLNIDRAPRRWPDIMQWGSSNGAGYLFSQRVIDDMTDAGVKGPEEILPVELQIERPSKSSNSPPQYVSLSLPRSLDLDLAASEFGSTMKMCLECGTLFDGNLTAKRYVPEPESWDGSDLFMLRRPQAGPVMLYCTRSILELARDNEWIGFRFEPIDIERHKSNQWKGINYLANTWPPKDWYSS